jgi:NitT/TauT family transport system permease protein
MSQTELTTAAHPVLREEYVREAPPETNITEIQVRLSPFEKLYNNTAARKIFILAMLALAWQAYAVRVDNELMFPTFTDTVQAFISASASGELGNRMLTSLQLLGTAYILGVAIATVMTILAITTRLGSELLDVCTSMFNPLPAIALLPLAFLWFGLGAPSIIFVIIHAVLWPLALNIYTGFSAVSATLRMVGRSYELRGFPLVFRILIPAAFASILTGLKVAWAFAWRTLIAAELVFGASSRSGGLGWFISEKKNQLDIAYVFAGLLAIILIGVVVENVIFKYIEKKTIVKWGMKIG